MYKKTTMMMMKDYSMKNDSNLFYFSELYTVKNLSFVFFKVSKIIKFLKLINLIFKSHIIIYLNLYKFFI